MASSSRDFRRAALQRLTTADFLLEHKYTLDAMYLGGYAIECALKSLILHLTLETDRNDMLRQIRVHQLEKLASILKQLNEPIPLPLARGFRRYGWSPDLRYQSGRVNTGEARGFLKTAKDAYDWVEGKLP